MIIVLHKLDTLILSYSEISHIRIKIKVLVSDSLANPLIDNILNVISTGSDYDGKIFFYDVAKAYDIGKKTGDSAL
jgi:nitrogen regulatory protein PII